MASLWGGGGVHWAQICGASDGLSWCVPCLCPFAAFALVGLLANMPLFGVFRAFLARFGVVVWVCVVWVLCVACGAFVRV